jgi:hypothetical protein
MQRIKKRVYELIDVVPHQNSDINKLALLQSEWVN